MTRCEGATMLKWTVKLMVPLSQVLLSHCRGAQVNMKASLKNDKKKRTETTLKCNALKMVAVGTNHMMCNFSNWRITFNWWPILGNAQLNSESPPVDLWGYPGPTDIILLSYDKGELTFHPECFKISRWPVSVKSRNKILKVRYH